MYPYRRNNQRKRSRTGTRRNKSAGRRLPGSARELLPLMQPATKALAQVLAGNTKPSGQFVYARSMAERADQMIAEKQLDRLTMRDREEFLEQLARLKLTVTDAEDEFGPLEVAGEGDGEDEAAEGDEAPAIEVEEDPEALEEERRRAEAEAAEQRERLKRVALALMSPSTATEPAREPLAGPSIDAYQPRDESAAAGRPRRDAAATRSAARAASTPRRPRITLRSSDRDAVDAKNADGEEHGVASDS